MRCDDRAEDLGALLGRAIREALAPAGGGRRAYRAGSRALADALSFEHCSHVGEPALLVAESRERRVGQNVEGAPALQAAEARETVGGAPTHDPIRHAVRAGKRPRGDSSCRGWIAYARPQRLGFPIAKLGGSNSPRRHIPWPCPEAITEYGVICVSGFFRFAPQQTVTPVVSRRGSSTPGEEKGLMEIKAYKNVRCCSCTTKSCLIFMYALGVGTFPDSEVPRFAVAGEPALYVSYRPKADIRAGC